MAELDKLLLQSRQIAERIQVLSEEHQTLRIKYHLSSEQHDSIAGSSGAHRSQPPSKVAVLLRKVTVRRRVPILS